MLCTVQLCAHQHYWNSQTDLIKDELPVAKCRELELSLRTLVCGRRHRHVTLQRVAKPATWVGEGGEGEFIHKADLVGPGAVCWCKYITSTAHHITPLRERFCSDDAM